MAIQVITAVGGALSILWRIGNLLMTVATFVMPLIFFYYMLTNGLDLALEWLIPLLETPLPQELGVNVSRLTNVIDLSKVNSFVPLSEMIVLVKAWISFDIACMAVRAFIKFVTGFATASGAAGKMKQSTSVLTQIGKK